MDMTELIQKFADTGYANLLTFSVSVISLLFSWWTFCLGRRTNRQLLDIEKSRDERDISQSNSARLRAKMHHEQLNSPAVAYHLRQATSTIKYLVIENSGMSGARNVKVCFNGKRSTEHDIEVLGPGSTTGGLPLEGQAHVGSTSIGLV